MSLRCSVLALLLVSCASPAEPSVEGQAAQASADLSLGDPGAISILAPGAILQSCIVEKDMARTVIGTTSGPKTIVSACFPYRCESPTGTCTTTCTTTLTCAQGATCQGGRCVAQRFFCDPSGHASQSSVKNAAGEYPFKPCVPYACDDFTGMCRSRCESGADCYPGYRCNYEYKCVPPGG